MTDTFTPLGEQTLGAVVPEYVNALLIAAGSSISWDAMQAVFKTS